MPTLYIETTIPSYLVAKPSRNIITLARQHLTKDWWDDCRDLYEMFISQVVLDEIKRGDILRERIKELKSFRAFQCLKQIMKLKV